MLMILVVEDERMIGEMLREMLEDEGYRVALAGNGREALAQLEQVQPHLILSDMMMPMMGGGALCRVLQHHPRYRHVPVVLMSAAKEPPQFDPPCYDAFLPKLFDLAHMLTTVAVLSVPIFLRRHSLSCGTFLRFPRVHRLSQ